MVEPSQPIKPSAPYVPPSSRINKGKNVTQNASSGGTLESIEKFLAFLVTAPYWISVGVLGVFISRIFPEDGKKRLRNKVIGSLGIDDETKKEEMEAGLSHFSEEELNLLLSQRTEVHTFMDAMEKANVPLNRAAQFLKRPLHERLLLVSILKVSTKDDVSQILNLMEQKNLEEFYSFKLHLENIIENKETANKVCRLLALMTEEERMNIINTFPFDQIRNNQPLPEPPQRAEEIFNLLKKKE